MRNLKLFENFENGNPELDEIMDCIIELYEISGIEFSLVSITGTEIKYSDYTDQTSKYNDFKVSRKVGGKILGRFEINITIKSKEKTPIDTHNTLLKILDEMQDCIKKLTHYKWSLFTLDASLTKIRYQFLLPDIIIDGKLNVTREEIKVFLYRYGLELEHFSIDDKCIEISFEPLSYDGRLPKNMEEIIKVMKEYFGFNSYSYMTGDHDASIWTD